MRYRAVVDVPLRPKHGVREVVVLVDEEVEMITLRPCAGNELGELARGIGYGKIPAEGLVVSVAISHEELVKPVSDVRRETLFKGLARASVDLGEVQKQHLVSAGVLGRVPSDVQVAEERGEVLLLRDVVVCPEHVDEERLAEAARTHEEEEGAAHLNGANIHRLVDVVVALAAKTLEVRNAVRYLEVASHGVYYSILE